MEKWINLNVLSTLPIFNGTARVMHKLLMLAIREDDQWKVFLNTNVREEIMEYCNIPKSSYCRAIKELEDCGFLTRDKDIYILNMLNDKEVAPIIFKR